MFRVTDQVDDVKHAKDAVINILKIHNRKHIKKDIRKTQMMVIKHQNTVVAGIVLATFWDICMVDELYIADNQDEVLLGTLLLKHAEQFAYSLGIPILDGGTNSARILAVYKAAGFKLDGTLDDRPKGHTYYFLSLMPLKKQKVRAPKGYTTDKTPQEDDVDTLKTMIRKEKEQRLGKQNSEEVTIFLLDEDDSIKGGIIGVISWDYLYISIVAVCAELRKLGYATKLMEKAEAIAREKGIKNVFLGTASFQAKPFYEKLGFETFTEQIGIPHSHSTYMMRKTISA